MSIFAAILLSVAPTLSAQAAESPPGSSPQGVYGIDVATSQSDLDFEAIRKAGYQFAIVKAGGSNVSPTYTAPFYQKQVERARAAGLLVGHYWVAGSRDDPKKDAKFFVDHLSDYREGDILVLDNEGIDDGEFWNDEKTASFLKEVQSKTGRLPLFYTNSSLVRSIDWPQTKALGTKLWIAHFTTPAKPNIGNAFPTWVIHQYSDGGKQDIIPFDIDIAKLDAFEGLSQPPNGETGPPVGAIIPPKASYTVEQGKIIQRIAAVGGYTGPIDGDPGNNTWLGVSRVLKQSNVLKDAETNEQGLQRLAQKYGYTGAIDGVLNADAFAGLRAYLDSRSAAKPNAVSVKPSESVESAPAVPSEKPVAPESVESAPAVPSEKPVAPESVESAPAVSSIEPIPVMSSAKPAETAPRHGRTFVVSPDDLAAAATPAESAEPVGSAISGVEEPERAVEDANPAPAESSVATSKPESASARGKAAPFAALASTGVDSVVSLIGVSLVLLVGGVIAVLRSRHRWFKGVFGSAEESRSES
ncbi:glycoside hydrolase family 25 protein [Luethyella okanaganae]|uniref:GH25 family lysozyme n=1 Tax=Luethyella okanaganae TaxID=69372 RepID=A0ABW1VFV6_9MICO